MVHNQSGAYHVRIGWQRRPYRCSRVDALGFSLWPQTTVKFCVYLLSSILPREDKVAPYSREMECRRSFRVMPGAQGAADAQPWRSGLSNLAQKIAVFTRAVLVAIVIRACVLGIRHRKPVKFTQNHFLFRYSAGST